MLPFLLNPVQHKAVGQRGGGALWQAPGAQLTAFGSAHARVSSRTSVVVVDCGFPLGSGAVATLQAAAAFVPDHVMLRRQRRRRRRRSAGACRGGRCARRLHHLFPD